MYNIKFNRYPDENVECISLIDEHYIVDFYFLSKDIQLYVLTTIYTYYKYFSIVQQYNTVPINPLKYIKYIENLFNTFLPF